MTTTETIVTRDQPLQNYYRPDSFDQVVGHKSVVASLKAQLQEKGHPHCYLFTGPSGTGKTTLARIIAKEVGATKAGIIELDGATNGKIEDIRNLVQDADYMPTSGRAKVYIIDECHSITKAAWQAFLKSTEDVPKHVYYIFCTTEENKIIPTIKTRCAHYQLKALPWKTLFEYGKGVICDLEDIKLSDEAIQLIAQESNGSPRQFLNYLGQVKNCSNLDEIRQILVSAQVDEKSAIIRLANMFINGNTNWNEYRSLLGDIEDIGSSRAILRAYLSKVALGRTDWQRFYIVMAAIEQMTEFPQEKDGLADLEVCIWRIIGAFSKQAH